MSRAPADGGCPYKGLIPYTEQDAAFFFGREQDQAIITANLMSTRLTVLYGPTGAGKSSVLRAGVAHALNLYAQQNSGDDGQPDVAVLVFNNWRDNPVAGLAGAIHTIVTKALRAADRPGVDETLQLDLTAALERWARHFKGELLIILDQFEEYFLYHAHADGDGTFAVEFPKAVNRADLPVNFVLSLREDALSKLDRFKGRLPQLFDNYLRMPRLTRAAAREAITGPLDEYNRRQPNAAGRMSIEPALVEAVLEQVQTGRVTLAREGSGGSEPVPSEAGPSIETAYLQLVLTRLWNEELRQGSRQLRLRTLTALKGAENIVRTHLDTVMGELQPAERDTATEVLRYLVTPSGTKIAYTATDLAIYAKTPVARLTPVLESLTGSGVRILRTVEPPPDQPQATRYEIFHDVLAQAVLDWCARYEQEKEKRRLQAEIAQVQQKAQQTLLERQRAQELLDARKLAEAEARRAEDQARAAQQLRRRNRLVTGAALVAALAALAALVFGVLAGQSRSAALKSADTAQAANISSDASLRTAQAAATEAHNQAVIAQTNEAAAQAAQAAAQVAQATAVRLVTEYANIADQAGTSAASARDALATLAAGTAAAATPDITATAAVEQSQADEAESQRLAGLSGEFVNNNERLALLLAVEAYNTFSSQAATDALQAALNVSAAYSLEPLPGFDTRLEGKIYDVAFSPDGHTLAAVSDAGEIYEMALGGNAVAQYRSDQPGRLFAAAFSPDGRLLAVGSDVSAANNMWEAAGVSTGKPIRSLGETDDWLISIDFHPSDPSLMALGRVDSDIFLWDWGQSSLVKKLAGHADDVWGVAWSPNGELLASGSADSDVRLWEAGTWAPKALLEGHTDIVRSVAWSPNGTLLASGSRDNTIILWDVERGEKQALLKGHTGEVRSVAFSPDGKLLASGGADELVLVWNVADQSIVAEIKNNDSVVTSLAFATVDGEVLLAAGSYDRTLKLYRVQGDQQQSDGPLTAQACQRAQSNFTVEEWFRFFSVDYRVTCSDYPAGD